MNCKIAAQFHVFPDALATRAQAGTQ